MAAVGAVGVTTLFGLLFVRKARASRRRQIEELESPVAAAPRKGRRGPAPEVEEDEDAEQPPTRGVAAEPEADASDASSAVEPAPVPRRPAQVLPFPVAAKAPKEKEEEGRPDRRAEVDRRADEGRRIDDTAPAPEVVAPPAEAPAPPSPRKRNALAPGLAKTRSGWISRLGNLFVGKREIDPGLLDEIEKVLLTADIGVRTANKLLEEMRASLSRKELGDPESAWAFLQKRSLELLSFGAPPLDWKASKPMVLLVIGVNGSGKTTTIGKLASKLIGDGKKVLVGAGDTFRAAAAEQLEIWANRVGATLVRGKEGADPSSVLFDAVKRAAAESFDVVLADTAGRLHTKTDLMEELQKVRRVIGKAAPGAPHETWLVIDSTSGQNAIAQAQIFTQAMSVSGIVLTKLDGTAKGGVILGIADQLQIPVRFIGIGERVEDLREFDAAEFVEALFERDDASEGPSTSVTSAR
ncbi:MAG TPA: signal recognition particle-docking protein FtsY [Polyangia bacterium]